jgi:hypothetical protein
MTSPYFDKPVSLWLKITKNLLARQPLKVDVILDVALQSWAAVWNTRVGEGQTAIELKQLDVPATVVGYFFEVLFAKEMETRFPGEWRGCRQGDEKDLVYLPDPQFCVEIKTSGQRGLKFTAIEVTDSKCKTNNWPRRKNPDSTSQSTSIREVFR